MTIHKEGFNILLLGSPATSFGVFISSLIHFTLYQNFQKYFISKEFDKEISDSLNNLEIFRLMELNHSKKYEDSINENDIIIKYYYINNLKFQGFPQNNLKVLKSKHSQNIDWDYNSKCFQLHLNKITKICGISGLLSGIGLALITAPIDNIRIKMQSVQNVEILEKAKYRNTNTLSCIIKSYNIFGIRGFYKAFPLSILREGIASTIYFMSFEYLKNKEKIKTKSKKIKLHKSFIFGAIAGGLNWLITFPIDTVKTKVISDSIIENKKLYKNTFDCVKINFSKYGIKGFYSGFSIVFFRGLIVNGVVLSSFDFCRSRFI